MEYALMTLSCPQERKLREESLRLQRVEAGDTGSAADVAKLQADIEALEVFHAPVQLVLCISLIFKKKA